MAGIFEKVRSAQFNSQWARSLLNHAFKEGENYRILLGPLRGFRLQYNRTVNYHAILGLWDLETFRFLKSFLVGGGYLKDGYTIADVGANMGLFTLWASRLLLPFRGKVHAFEPAPTTLEMLQKNIELNQTSNIEVVSQAVSDQVGTVDFFFGHHHHTSSLCAEWAAFGGPTPEKVTVACTTLDRHYEGKPLPDFIKVDIEGGGCFALYGIDRCLEEKRPILWIESHTPTEDRAIGELMCRNDYLAFRHQTKTFVKNLYKTHPEPDGVWGTLLLFPKEQYERVRSIVGTTDSLPRLGNKGG